MQFSFLLQWSEGANESCLEAPYEKGARKEPMHKHNNKIKRGHYIKSENRDARHKASTAAIAPSGQKKGSTKMTPSATNPFPRQRERETENDNAANNTTNHHSNSANKSV
jgi:hypothetical protein